MLARLRPRHFFLAISARNSRSFALMARAFAGPMRISSFCPAERLSRSASAYSRSEEHTSELQSHHDLVCRLLLEKKKDAQYTFSFGAASHARSSPLCHH